MSGARTLPELTAANRFFWTSGVDGVLRFLRCSDCHLWQHPPGAICPRCLGRNLSPQPVSGLATVETFTVNHQRWSPEREVPYVVAIVSIDEDKAIRLTTNIVGTEPDRVFIGQRVRVEFEQVDDVYLPLFTPVMNEATA